MKTVTFTAVTVVIPALLALGLFSLLAPTFGEPEAAGAGVLAFGAAALAGRRLDAKYWDWGRHQVLTGRDAARFVGKVALLDLLTAAAFALGYKVCHDLRLELPAAGGALASAFAFFSSSFFFFSKEYKPFIRGTRLLTLEGARAKARARRKRADPGFSFGGVPGLPSRLATMHYLLLGAVGSGKTKTLECLMRTLLPTLNTLDARAIVFDPKREVYQYIDALRLGRRVIIFDPTDARCWAWRLAADIRDEDDARAWGEIAVPRNDHATQPYFDNAARELLIAVVCHLQRKMPLRWSLRHVVHVMLSARRIKALLSTTREGRETLELYFKKEKTLDDVMSTVATHLGPYKSVAKAWASAEREGRAFSIEEWLGGNDVVLLGSSNKAGPTVRDINRLFLTRVSQELLDEPDNDQSDLLSPKSRRHYLFLDELRFLGKLDNCLPELFLLDPASVTYP
jgi:hypothetical protein